MTAAERQRRHRKKVKADRRRAEYAIVQELNDAKLRDPVYRQRQAERDAEQAAWYRRQDDIWNARYARPALPGAWSEADEIARQIDEYLLQCPEISIDDVRVAIDRRFGPKAS